MKKFLIAMLLLAASTFTAAQTTTYTVSDSSSGTYTYPFRAFSIPLTNNAEIPWLQIGGQSSTQYSCGYGGIGTPTGIGFIFLQDTVVNEGGPQLCINLSSGNNGNVAFSGLTPSGVPFYGTFNFTFTTRRGGYGRFVHTIYTITSGTLTITE